MIKSHIFMLFMFLMILCFDCGGESRIKRDIVSLDRTWILEDAEKFMTEQPVTVTAESCARSNGNEHDFYSEGDYWWPDPENPQGPYIRRDGMTNPENFTAHREAMRRMSIQVATLAAAYKINGDTGYAAQAVKHLKAWFVDESTRMSPHMNFAQAIKGRVPGRGVGLIDGIHLVEPVRAIDVLVESKQLSAQDLKAIKNWFAEFLNWMNTHEYGIDERERTNNHGTCWVMQAAEFARLTGNEKMLEYCRDRYKTVLLPNQMSEDGSFHLELERTKPYGYSLFNMDIMAAVCHILSVPEDNLWDFHLESGQGIDKAMEFIVPFIADKTKWPFPPDVMYWDQWPVRHPALLFAGIALQKPEYIELWKRLKPVPETDEGLRNFPIRQPVLWVD